MATLQRRLNRCCSVRIAVICGQHFDRQLHSNPFQVVCTQGVDAYVVMMSDDRTASPLIRKGRAVLGYASAMDRVRSARPISRLRTCHSDVTKCNREGN